MSHSKFYSSLLLLIVLNAVIKPIWIFGIDRQVQNITGVAEYGVYFSLLNLSIVFGFLLDWGLNNFVNRELAAKKTDLQRQLGSLLFLKLLFFFLYMGVVLGVGKLSGISRWDILWGVIVIQFLTFLFLFLRNVVTANQWFKTDAFLSVLDKSLMIFVCGSFIVLPAVFGRMNIEKFIIAQIGCTSVATIVVIVILVSRGISIKKPSFSFINRGIIMSVLPFAVTIFLMSVHLRLDGFLLERLHANGAHEAGIYAAAYRLLDASNMVGYLIASFFMPFIARLWADRQPLQDVLLQTRHIQLMIAITISAISIMLAPALQIILYHRHDPYGVQILQWCLPALIGYGLSQVYGTIMTATGSIVSFCYLNFVAVTINVVMNVLLIPKYGALSCCISALCSQLFLGIASTAFVHHKLKTSVDARSICLYVFDGLILCGFMYFLSKTSISALVMIPVVVLITFLVMWLGKLVSLNTWLSFLKKQ